MNIDKNADALAAPANPRAAYVGELLLTANHSASTDAWQTGLNNSVLVLGCSGGKDRGTTWCPACSSARVLRGHDGRGRSTTGSHRTCAPAATRWIARLHREGAGTVGYDPLAHVRWSHGRPNTQDVIAVANAVCSAEDMGSDPFWGHAAANYLASYVAYVLEAVPERSCNMASVVRVFEQAADGHAGELFEDLEHDDPGSFAVSLYRRARATARAERMHASIMGIIAADILPFSHEAAMASYERPRQVDFAELGRKKCALFVTMDDLDHSMTALTSLFVRQAFCSLCDEADASEGGRLPVPVRFMLDDFANLRLPDFDDVLSVIRSREFSCTVVCQTVSQLEARYGEASANSIVGNCDRHLVLAFPGRARVSRREVPLVAGSKPGRINPLERGYLTKRCAAGRPRTLAQRM